MSTYYRMTKNPKTGRWENACWMDDYLGRHHYGVKFPTEEAIVDPWDTQLTTTISEEDGEVLNAHYDSSDKG